MVTTGFRDRQLCRREGASLQSYRLQPVERHGLEILLVLFVAMPAGIYVPLKAAGLLLVILLYLPRLLRMSVSRASLIWHVFGISYICACAAYGFLRGNNYVWLQASQLLAPLLIYTVLSSATRFTSAEDADFMVGRFKFYICVYCIIRLTLFIAPLLGLVSYGELSRFFGDVGFVFQDLSSFGFPGLVRITTANDFILLAIVAHYALCKPMENSSIFYALTFIVLVLSFSRAFLVLAILALLIKNMTPRRALILFLMFALATPVIFNDSVTEFFAFRFADIDSTETKYDQSLLLFEGAAESYFLGNGLGHYLKHYIRSYYEPFTYENFLFQLVMQIGLIGTIYALTPYLDCIKTVFKSNGFISAGLFGGLLFGLNLTNPYFGSAGSIFILLFLAVSARQSYEQKE